MRLSLATKSVILLLLSAASSAMPALAEDSVSLRAADALTASELARLLDAHVWKFEVDLPAGAKHVTVGLEIKEKGHESRGFVTGVSGPIRQDIKREVLIAIIPIGGTLNEAEKVRVIVNGFGIYAAGTDDNPLRKLGIGRPQSPEDNQDGSFNLIGGYKGSPISTPVSLADKVISLKVTTSQN